MGRGGAQRGSERWRERDRERRGERERDGEFLVLDKGCHVVRCRDAPGRDEEYANLCSRNGGVAYMFSLVASETGKKVEYVA